MFGDDSQSLLARLLLERAAQPKTLNAAIDQFLVALSLTDSQSERVATRQRAVRDAIESKLSLPIDNSYLVGSYARDTQIRALDGSSVIDVDCIVILEARSDVLQRYYHRGDGGELLLEEMKTAIKDYQGLPVKIDRPCVTLTWADMKMEVTPAFRRQGGGFLIPPNSWLGQSWQATDPLTDRDLITERNKATGSEFKRMVRMLKCWNRTSGKILSSFAIEALAYEVTYSFRDLGFELSWFFQELNKRSGQFVAAPSKIGNAVKLDTNYFHQANIQNSESKVRQAFALADLGQHAQAIRLMGEVFGKPFPGAIS